MIRPDDRDATVRDLLRQPRPGAVDAARAARVRRRGPCGVEGRR